MKAQGTLRFSGIEPKDRIRECSVQSQKAGGGGGTDWEGDNESREWDFRIRLLALNADFDIHKLDPVE